MTIHSGGKAQSCKLSSAPDIIQYRIGPALLYRVLLPVKCVEITCVGGNRTLPAFNHVKEGLGICTPVFHGDFAVSTERHFPVAVIAPPRGHENGGSVQYGVFSIPVLEVLIIGAAEKGGDGRCHRGLFIFLPVDAQNEGMAHIPREPHMGQHSRTVHITQGDSFSRLDLNAGTQLFTVSASASAGRCSGGVLRREAETFSILNLKNRHNRSSSFFAFSIKNFYIKCNLLVTGGTRFFLIHMVNAFLGYYIQKNSFIV